jgi:hypothetical protein
MSLPWLALALLAADGGGGLRIEGSVAAGGGYDSSLLLAAGGEAAGSTVATVAASAGVALDLGGEASLYIGARADGATFAALSALDRTGAGAEASLSWPIADGLALVVAPSAGWSWYGDPARSGATASARATLRARPWPALVLRAGYAHLLRTAADPVHAGEADRVYGGVELRLAPGTWLGLAASAERGDQAFYREIPATSAEPASWEAYRAPATEVGGALTLWVELGHGLSLDVTAALKRVSGEGTVLSGPALGAALAWRWD